MLLIKDRQPRCSIVIGPNATWIERHAAEELQKYVKAISRAELAIADTAPAEGAIVAIGRAGTNPVVAGAVRQGLVHLSDSTPGGDGFIVATVNLNGRDALVLSGSSDRATLYAVYWLIEEVLGVGFFRDGEQIPDAPTIEVANLQIAERPYFREREDGLIAYSSIFWRWEEWKRELDWKAKRRATITWPFPVGGDIVEVILAEWGVHPEPPARSAEPTLHERLLDHARKLGIRVPCNLPNGALPEEFFKKFPNCRALLLQWSEYAPYRLLHPAEPLFKRLIVDYVRRYRERYGTDHLYIAEFASESRILEGASNVQEVRIQFARAMSEALREADPEGTWVPSSWTFDLSAYDPGNPWQAIWTVEDVREYLDAVTYPIVIWDTWSEEAAKYLRTDYFYGRPWGFAVLHCFGGETYLHGDIPDLVGRVHALIEDPKALNCDAFLALPEHVDYNSVYFELCAELAWNPTRVTVDGFVKQYCRKRYGPHEGELLEPAWRLLLETVYGPDSGTVKLIMDPLYWFRPDLKLLHGWAEDNERVTALWRARQVWPPKLRRTAELFLSRSELLRTNDMARRDLVDIARQWIAERFNISLIAARDAFLEGNDGAFESAAPRCLALLDDQARLLASWSPYRLDRQVEQARAQYGDDAARAVKHLHVWCNPTEGQRSVPLRDYYRMDLDGLVADYYKPRVRAYLDLLRNKLAAGERTVSNEELEGIYAPIEDQFIHSPLHVLPEGENPVAVVRGLVFAGES